MNTRYIHIFRTLAALLICSAALFSCSPDETDGGHDTTLPPGKYPLLLKATVGQMTSRVDKQEPEYWTKGDVIRVRIDEYPALGNYTLNEDGSVMASDEPLAWPYTDGKVRAWFPYFKLGATIDSQIDDQSNGYHDINFMTAVSENENYKNTVNLRFKHLMAKVRSVLTKGEGVTAEDLKTAEVKYHGFTKVRFSEEGVSGEVKDWITSTSDHSALLVPQDVSGPFITVDLTLTINGARIPKTLVYTPQEKMNLKAGNAYTFNIKVQKNRLEVQTISGTWTDSLENTVPTPDTYHINLPGEVRGFDFEFSSNVTPMPENWETTGVEYLDVLGDFFTISYTIDSTNCYKGLFFADKTTTNQVNRTYYEITQKTATTSDNTSDDSSVVPYYEFSYQLASPISEPVDLKFDEHIEVGDILFQDGKWAWGGISKTIYDEKWKKTPVGIVFKVGAGGNSTDGGLDVPANYKDCEGWNNREIRGYAVALEDAYSPQVKWSNTMSQIFFPAGSASIYYSGLYITNRIKNEVKNFKISNFPALEKAEEYNSKTDKPKGSSGWYLPSYPQLSDIRKLFTHPQRRELFTNAGGHFFLQTKRAYCSATELNSYNISPEAFAYDGFYNDLLKTKTKTNYFFIRTVLTF